MNRQTRARAALAELCRLGLATEQLVPAVLEALHELVPSSRNLFDWTDEHGQLLRYFFEGPIDPTIAQLYFDEFHNRREAEAMVPFAALPARRGGVHGARELDTPRFFDSALYAEIWRPQGLKYRLEAVLRGRRGQLLGSLVLYRGPGDRCFSPDDEQQLASVLPWLSDALEHLPAQPGPEAWLPAPEAAQTLTLDAQGRLLHATAGALHMLLLADGGITPARLRDGAAWAGRGLLGQLLQRLRAQPPAPPGMARSTGVTAMHDNAWGRFELQAQPLAALQPRGQALVLVTLRRHEARTVAVERVLRGLALTPGQHRVCRALLDGRTQEAIAQDLGVAPSSVADQVRKLCAHLGLRSVVELREQVQRKLVLHRYELRTETA